MGGNAVRTTDDQAGPESGDTPSCVTVEYLGHSAFRLRGPRGFTVLVDPFISENAACPASVGDVLDSQVLLLTHGAWDHFGDAIEILKSSSALAVCSTDVHRHLLASGIPRDQVRLLVWGGCIDVGDVAVRAVETRHISHVTTDSSFTTGIALGFIVDFRNGVTVYHAGDTSLFSDLGLFGTLYRPQIALLPVGAAPGFFAEMSPREAALAALWLGSDAVIPMHYVDPADAELFRIAVEAIAPHSRAICLRPGESLRYQRIVDMETVS